MGNFNRVKRVETGAGDWIDVRPFSVGEARACNKRTAKLADATKVSDVCTDEALRRIVAWSDSDVPVTSENALNLPAEIAELLWLTVSNQEALIPLLSSSPSIATSEENAEA